MVEAISAIPEVKRIRLGSLEPRIITDSFLERLRVNRKFCPHFHLSLQSACNATLKRMNRKYTIEEFSDKCKKIRSYFEYPAITTDVIVGFPGETEEEFELTYQQLTQLKLYEIHVFKYSVRAGTVAEKLPDQVLEETKNERSDRLLELTARQKAAYEAELNGFVDEVLVEEEWENAGSEKKLLDVRVIGREERNDYIALDQNRFRYYTGHTKRYVKVRLLAEEGLVNQIVKVQME